MPEENATTQPTESAAEPQPEEPTWASEEVEVYPGKRMRRGDVIKSYGEAERRMHEATEAEARARKEMEGYAWAKAIQERYHTDPEFKEEYDRIWQGEATSRRQPNVLSPEMQELHRQRVEIDQLRLERQIEDLKAQGRTFDKSDELKMLRYVQEGNARDITTAYKALFYDRDVRDNAERASQKTAQEIAEQRGAYEPPPKGAAPRPTKTDVRGLSPEELRRRAIADIEKSGIITR